MNSTKDYSLYLHIPFCTRRCGYCDFNTYAGLESQIPAYVDALCREIQFVADCVSQRLPVTTIFFGGGTPSLLSLDLLEQVLDQINRVFELQDPFEITLEANPGTLSLEYLTGLHGLGINRLSLGVQSTHPEELRLLERIHDYPQVIESVLWAREAGFENLNLDLIYALPEQKLNAWQRSLELVLDLHPEHLSLYALSLEHGTPFGRWAARGLLSTPDPDLAADMYEHASSLLVSKGYTQYEISNWAQSSPSDSLHLTASPGLACRHNLQYWRNLPYLGFGAGAHGYTGSFRTANVLSPSAYIKGFLTGDPKTRTFPRTPATLNLVPIDRASEIAETMMMGLRLTREGVSENSFYQRFNLTLEASFPSQIERLIQLELLEWVTVSSDRHLRLTQAGRLLGNQVFKEFI